MRNGRRDQGLWAAIYAVVAFVAAAQLLTEYGARALSAGSVLFFAGGVIVEWLDRPHRD